MLTFALMLTTRFLADFTGHCILHGLAAILGAVATFHVAKQEHWFYQNSWILTDAELLFVMPPLWMTIRLQQRHTQQTWIRCRFVCELFRDVRASIPVINPLHPLVAVHDPDFEKPP